MTKNVDGVSNLIYSINKIINGDINTAYATEKKEDGDNSHADTLYEKMDGVIPVNNTFPPAAGTLKTPQHYLVQNALRKLTVKSTVSGIFNSATILIQLYTHPRNSYKDLRRLTGLSEDGLTKRIMAMKKRGLIVRTGFQQYTLTGTAQIIINEAMR